MSKFINTDAIIDRVCEGISCNECSFGTNEDGMSECVLDKRIAELPTADVAPAAHGEWIPNESDRHHHCSVCGEDALCKEDWQFLDCVEILSEYCPNCGAKMDGEK